eukprot:4169522-Prymnesium_polylepis.1
MGGYQTVGSTRSGYDNRWPWRAVAGEPGAVLDVGATPEEGGGDGRDDAAGGGGTGVGGGGADVDGGGGT